MSIAFRNVEGSITDPVSQWPYEALVSSLERGTLADWKPILAEIRASPWGVVARQIESYLSYTAAYGVGPLFQRAIRRARLDWARRERDEVAAEVRACIERSVLTCEQFARLVGTSRSRLSTYASGSVVPSATLMLRMQRLAQLAQRDS